MSDRGRPPLADALRRLFPRMRFPGLFLLLAALLAVDLVLPDPLPIVDEALLAVLTLLAGSLRRRRETSPSPEER